MTLITDPLPYGAYWLTWQRWWAWGKLGVWGPQGEKYIVYAVKHLSLPHKPEFALHTFLKHTTALTPTESAFCIQRYYKYVMSKHMTHSVFRRTPQIDGCLSTNYTCAGWCIYFRLNSKKVLGGLVVLYRIRKQLE